MIYLNLLQFRFYFTGAFCFSYDTLVVLCFWQCFNGKFNFYYKHRDRAWGCLWAVCFSAWPYTCLLFSFHLLTYPGFCICVLYLQLTMWWLPLQRNLYQVLFFCLWINCKSLTNFQVAWHSLFFVLDFPMLTTNLEIF